VFTGGGWNELFWRWRPAVSACFSGFQGLWFPHPLYVVNVVDGALQQSDHP